MFHDKGSTVDSQGARQTTVAFENFREFTATGLLKFPVPQGHPTDLARKLDDLAQRLSSYAPGGLLRRWESRGIMPGTSIRDSFEVCRREWNSIREQMIALQEELDWECYRLYGLLVDQPDLEQRITVGQPPPAVLVSEQDQKPDSRGRLSHILGSVSGVDVGQPPPAVFVSEQDQKPDSRGRLSHILGSVSGVDVGQPPPAVFVSEQDQKPDSRGRLSHNPRSEQDDSPKRVSVSGLDVGQPPPAVLVPVSEEGQQQHSRGRLSHIETRSDAKRVVAESRRNLPHLQAEGKTYEITFCSKNRWVLPEEVRDRVLQHCLHDHGLKIQMHAAVVMPDHVHLLLTPLADSDGNFYGLSEIMNGIKGASAHSVNRLLGREGPGLARRVFRSYPAVG